MVQGSGRLANVVLDWGERNYWIVPLGAVNSGLGLGMISMGGGWGWLYAAFGLLLSLIRPAGTTMRRQYRIRRFRRQLETDEHAIMEWGR